MPYSQFTTLKRATDAFNLNIKEEKFFPPIQPIAPSALLKDYLEDTLIISATASEKARSEGIIYPVLLEVRRILNKQISLFSGEDFSVDDSVGLNGLVDFLLSRSPLILEIQAPVAVIVEAKKADIKSGYGQCVAEMVAAQRFNLTYNNSINTIFGSITNGTQWRFLKLEENNVTIDLTDYTLPPVDQILGFYVWMMQQ
ncbi:hypothetical protein NIES4071_46160 [Calothrix sp. NIES-4071]|nr:hypothetical protein NIES4071_46160 [Calothrix sp. NIES-4071]BAZ58927.1 hypothetical protein NIES4105_46090 [Calothrix sp. NIES-4105]